MWHHSQLGMFDGLSSSTFVHMFGLEAGSYITLDLGRDDVTFVRELDQRGSVSETCSERPMSQALASFLKKTIPFSLTRRRCSAWPWHRSEMWVVQSRVHFFRSR